MLPGRPVHPACSAGKEQVTCQKRGDDHHQHHDDPHGLDQPAGLFRRDVLDQEASLVEEHPEEEHIDQIVAERVRREIQRLNEVIHGVMGLRARGANTGRPS